ncbi:hypothetical protein [Candidatus Amarolinea dominans]|uniref:hypothetical protein n=1 Tax=Candidatus Amarolinea dominans TaxID=3140696 RepID=UPI003134D719|nr:hypothetical protein [Anaerolineae bacterium]
MMHINDFPRPPDDNGRGLHWSARVYHPTNEPTRGTGNAEEDTRYAMSARIYRDDAADVWRRRTVGRQLDGRAPRSERQ